MIVKYIDDEGDEIELTLPSKKEVCHACDGHGTVLCEGMRGHAYTMSEFQEEFDDEEQAEYFKRGGRYDVVCPECNGQNVIDIPDVDAMSATVRAQFEEYCKYENERAQLELYERAERRAERGLY